MLNAVHLMGRLTTDPEFHQTEDYKSSRFTLAVSRDFKNKKTGEREADFIRITAWGSLADFVCSYMKKGQLIAVSGALRTRHYLDKDGNKRTATEVMATDIYIAGSNKAKSELPTAADDNPPESPTEYNEYDDYVGDIKEALDSDDN